MAVVRVDLSLADVDVNVHPQKAEVRFSDAQAVYAAVRHVVARGVANAPWLAEGAGVSTIAFRNASGQTVAPMNITKQTSAKVVHHSVANATRTALRMRAEG